MTKLEEWMSRMRGKDWNPIFDRVHVYTVRFFAGATLASGVYTLYAMYRWKQEIDLRDEVRNFQIQEERRRSQVEEGERLEEVKERPLKELEDNTPDLKDSAKRYKFS